jgi:hypothetical protein
LGKPSGSDEGISLVPRFTAWRGCCVIERSPQTRLAPATARRPLVAQALAKGEAVERRSDAPAWAILQVKVAAQKPTLVETRKARAA